MYKLIIGSDPYQLEERVNRYLEDNPMSDYIGTIQVLGHEAYAQVLDVEELDEIEEEECPF